MATTTFQTLYEYARRRFHNKAGSNAVIIQKECVNRAMRRIAERDHPYFITQGYINLVAPYSSGTCAVAEGGTTVSVATGTWETAMNGRYIKINDERVHYLLSAWDGTGFTFDGGAKWLDDTDATADYVIYQDTYSLPSDFRCTDKVMEKRMLTDVEWLNDEGEWYLKKMQNYGMTGPPRWACMANGKLMIWPYETDITVLSFLYYRWPTELSSASATMDFDDNQVDLVRAAIDWEIAIERGKEDLIRSARLRYEDKEQKMLGAATEPHESIQIGGAGPVIRDRYISIGDDEP
ncbi:MAG: phage adaptor protein [Planctomycetota bacterium]|jgi:hypothetical protein